MFLQTNAFLLYHNSQAIPNAHLYGSNNEFMFETKGFKNFPL